jgi:hypothetical protein
LDSGAQVGVGEGAGFERQQVALDGFLGAAQLRLDHLQLVVVLLADAVEAGRGGLNRQLE